MILEGRLRAMPLFPFVFYPRHILLRALCPSVSFVLLVRPNDNDKKGLSVVDPNDGKPGKGEDYIPIHERSTISGT